MSPRVLITDDSMLMRHMIADTLKKDGWEVVGCAADSDQAIAMYKEYRPDVVTLDIVMPDTNGLQTLEGIIEFDPNAKVVVVSALSKTNLISEAIRKGAQDFISKPFLPEQLQEMMRKFADHTAAV